MKVAVIILGAGSSSRMGKPKQLLPYKNTTLLGNAIQVANQSLANNVFCVLGANFEIIKKSIEQYNCNIILNPKYKDGLSSSIKTAVKELQNFDKLLFMLGDQPKITFDFLNELLNLSEENPTKIIASDYGNKKGVPAIFPKKYFSELLTLSGDKGASKMLNLHQENIIKLKNNFLVDIDTFKEYLKLIKT